MTLAARNTLLTFGLVVIAVLLAAYVASVYSLTLGRLAPGMPPLPDTQAWFGRVRSVAPRSVYVSLASTGITAFAAGIAVFAATRVFRRVSSAAVYFTLLFMAALPFETLRIGQLVLQAAKMPGAYGLLITRAVLFGRLFGSISLFAAGVYAAGADYPRIGFVTIVLATLAFLVIYLLPVDSARISATLVHHTGGGGRLDAFLLFLGVAAVVNYAIGWARGTIERGAAMTICVLAMVAGRELLTNVPDTAAQIVSPVLLCGGAIALVLVNRSYYLWY